MKNLFREKVIHYMAKGKVMMIHLIVGMIKKISLYKMSYFSEPNNGSKKKLNYICLIMHKKKKKKKKMI